MRTLRRTRGYIWKSRGPRPGKRGWNTRTPAAPCARRFCGSFFRRASHSQPAGPRTARAVRGARSGDPSPHLSGPDWSPRPAWTISWCKRVKRRAPAGPPVPAHTPAHTPAHAPAQHDFDADDSDRRTIGGNGTRCTPQRPILRWHQDAHTPQGLHRISFRGPLGVRHCPATSTGCFRAFGVVAYFSSAPVGGPRIF